MCVRGDGGRGGQRSDVVVSASVDATDVAKRFRSRPCGARRKKLLCVAADEGVRPAARNVVGMSRMSTEEKVFRRSASRCNDGRKKSPEYPDLLHTLAGGGGDGGDGGAGLQNIKSETRLAAQFDSARLSERLRRLLSSAY